MPEASIRQLAAANPALSFGATAIATALERLNTVSIVANLTNPSAKPDQFRCWRCARNGAQIHLEAYPEIPAGTIAPPTSISGTERLTLDSGDGDILIVCDPWGDNESLCRALQTGTRNGVGSVSITGDQPNLIAALAQHPVRVPVARPSRPEFVVTVLRHLISLAAAELIATERRSAARLTTQRLAGVSTLRQVTGGLEL